MDILPIDEIRDAAMDYVRIASLQFCQRHIRQIESSRRVSLLRRQEYLAYWRTVQRVMLELYIDMCWITHGEENEEKC